MNWLRQIFSRRRRYDDISLSIQEHLEEKIDELMDDGMSREQAERKALREFGNIAQIEERSRLAWQWPAIESVLFDLKLSLRQFRKSPGFSFVVILILALGIGANTTVFSIVDAVILRPLPYLQAQRLVEVKSSQEDHFESSDVSYPDFFDWNLESHSFDHLISYHNISFTLTGVSRAQRLNGEVVSWDLLPALGIAPELGRGFTRDEEKQGSRVLSDQSRVVDVGVRGRCIGAWPHTQPERESLYRRWRYAAIVSIPGYAAKEQLLDNNRCGRRPHRPSSDLHESERSFSNGDWQIEARSDHGSSRSGDEGTRFATSYTVSRHKHET